MPVNRARIIDQLILHEGLRLKPYKDSLGIWTWLVGYNIEARGLEGIEDVLGRKLPRDFAQLTATEDEARRVLAADIDRIERAVPVYFPEYLQLDEVRQRVVIDMAFNMAFGALKFKKAIAAIKARNWSEAVRQLWDSRWSAQVGDGPGKKRDRADRLAGMLLTGQDYTN